MKQLAAIYARLSREDENKIDGLCESRSIENQIEFLTVFATENSFDIFKIYYDDGYSGGNTNRPSFLSMLEDMKKKKFQILIIKDLSRLGRSLHQVGDLVENVLPKYNIRLIAVTDHYDSLTYNGDESIVLRNFLNAYYLKDFKRKIHKSIEHRSHTKHMTSSPKYGYLVKTRGEVELDPYASGIVRRIFDLALDGVKPPAITKILNQEKILPRAKYQYEVLKLSSNHLSHLTDTWRCPMVHMILRDIEYCGHSINLSYSKKREKVLIKNTHPAIISDEEFERVQASLTPTKTRIYTKPDHISNLLKVEPNITVRCNYHSYKNPKYTAKGFKLNLDIDHLHSLIYKDIVNFITSTKENKDLILERIKQRKLKSTTANPKELKIKLKTLNEKYAKLFEANLIGTLNDIHFQKESSILQNEIINIETTLKNLTLEQTNIELYMKRFERFIECVDISSEDKLQIIRNCVKMVYISKDNQDNFIFRIVYKFEN
ncbi:MAG: recombinase family protein [Roseburia sp.]|nr:recombinase family protein [Anaeroplasma bactoclasticum]MCM1196666.1 recombinase family protein [Roseburia sp.]MCM1557449.1 recombinase family protein [Anaeroplasma bactoclasticum]